MSPFGDMGSCRPVGVLTLYNRVGRCRATIFAPLGSFLVSSMV